MRTSSSVQFASLRHPDGSHCRWAPVAELERMRHRKQCRRRNADRKTVYVLVDIPKPSESKPSPLMITVRDMMINAGVIAAPRDVVDAVREKLEYFKKVA